MNWVSQFLNFFLFYRRGCGWCTLQWLLQFSESLHNYYFFKFFFFELYSDMKYKCAAVIRFFETFVKGSALSDAWVERKKGQKTAEVQREMQMQIEVPKPRKLLHI
jgi:hypothetical protein